jgi:hypothetical protein
VSFGEQSPTFRRVTCLQSQALYVAVLRINQDILTVKATLPFVCKPSPNDAASQTKRLWISDIKERNWNLARKRPSIPSLLTRLAVCLEKLCFVFTHSGDKSKTRRKKQTNIAFQTQDNNQSFIYQLMHNWNCLKTNFQTAPTCFGVITIIRERTIRSC